MVDPVSVIALSITCFHGCMKGLILLSKASHYDRDLSNLRLQIELELHSLFTWAEAAGLTQEPPTLYMNIGHVSFVPQILSQLECLISDIGRLKTRHGLELKSMPENVQKIDDDDSTLSKLGPKPSEVVERLDTAVFHQRKSPWKKLRWVTLDEKKVRKLLEEVRGYVSKLEKFLEEPSQIKRQGVLDGVLRDAVLNLEDHQKLGIIGHKHAEASSNLAVASAARLKQCRVQLGLDNTLPSLSSAYENGKFVLHNRPRSSNSLPAPPRRSSSSLHSMRLPMRLLTLSRKARAATFRTMAQYDDMNVLLEWKACRDMHAVFLEKRVDQVAAFLHQLEPCFHSLPCLGYVKDHERNQYGYIFELPAEFQPAVVSVSEPSYAKSPSAMPELVTLGQLLDQYDIAPSLNTRLSIAVMLLENLLNLHTAGWLHKELRSDNVVFFNNVADSTARNGGLDPSSMYVAGYVSARADDPGEMTEAIGQDDDADIYRHPLSLGKTRASFRKAFDIFSVACTLLEIGMWSSFRQILEWHHSLDSLPDRPAMQRIPTFSSTTSGSTLVNNENGNGDGGEASDKKIRQSKRSADLMDIRQKLLLSQLDRKKFVSPGKNVTGSTVNRSIRCQVLQSLEAATGLLYTGIVEEMLSVGFWNVNGRGTDHDEHEYALDLEMRAADTLRAMTQAI